MLSRHYVYIGAEVLNALAWRSYDLLSKAIETGLPGIDRRFTNGGRGQDVSWRCLITPLFDSLYFTTDNKRLEVFDLHVSCGSDDDHHKKGSRIFS